MIKNSRGSNAKKTVVDGIKFDSKDEARYYTNLKCNKECAIIVDFKLQPKYILQEKFKGPDGAIRAIIYQADFEVTHLDETLEIVDVKGFSTPDALIKRKMFLKTHPHLLLSWVSYVKKYGGFIDYWELKKLSAKNKK